MRRRLPACIKRRESSDPLCGRRRLAAPRTARTSTATLARGAHACSWAQVMRARRCHHVACAPRVQSVRGVRTHAHQRGGAQPLAAKRVACMHAPHVMVRRSQPVACSSGAPSVPANVRHAVRSRSAAANRRDVGVRPDRIHALAATCAVGGGARSFWLRAPNERRIAIVKGAQGVAGRGPPPRTRDRMDGHPSQTGGRAPRPRALACIGAGNQHAGDCTPRRVLRCAVRAHAPLRRSCAHDAGSHGDRLRRARPCPRGQW